MFGGSPKFLPGEDDQKHPKIAETTVVRLESVEISGSDGESPTREWVVMGVAKGRQLGSLERIREKMQEKTTSLVPSELDGERENVQNTESKITELEEKVESAETRVRVALARAVRAEIRCDRIPHLEQQLRSTQHLLHTQKDEFKSLTTQYKTTCDQLLHNREQFTTQQQALSLLQYTAQQKEEQLQANVHERAALQAENQALANQVVALQRTVAQLEHRIQATQAALHDSQKQIPHLEQQLHSKQAKIQSLTEAHHKLTHWQSTIKPVTASISTQTDSTSISTVQSTQLGLQSGVISPHYPAELPAQHAETQQKVTRELLLPEIEEIQELQQKLNIKATESQEQTEQLTTLQEEEQKLQSTQRLLHAKEDEFKALTTQYRATHVQLLHNQEQLSTQQQALSHMQHNAQQKEEHLQAKVHEIEALQAYNQALANQVAALQTDTVLQTTQLGLQTGAIGPHHPTQLPIEHAEMQQQVLAATERIQELQQQLKVRFIENQEQREQLTLVQAEKQTIREQVKLLEIEKQKLQEELTKETFLETALGYEVDVLREDLMDREDKLYCLRTQQVEQHTTSSEAAVVDTHSPTTSPALGFLRGAEVVAQRDFVITNKAQTYSWEEYGFRLHVPDGSLEAGLSETTVSVRVTLSGHFQLPANSELVSAVYWVFSPHKFSQPLTVDIEHCAAPSQCSNLSFVRTKCTQKNLPYQFKELEGGVFSQKSTYGSISVNHFSGLGIIDAVKHWWFRKSDQDNSLIYCAQLYAQDGMKEQCVHFVVTRNLESCLTEVKNGLADSGCKKSCSFLFEFDDQLSLRLDVPHDGTTFESGWTLFPLYEPTIKKNHVDHFSCGQQLPECELAVQWLKDSPPASFKHKIGLQGARERTFFTLFLKQTDVSSGSKSENLTQHTFNISSGSESDSLYSPDSVKSGKTILPTFSVSSPLPPIPTHKHLMNEVAAKIPAKWRFIGSELGLQPYHLNAIEKEQNGILALCFSAVFHKWECETSPPYSWSTIITALEAPQVGANHLAQSLKGRT